jgi:glutamine amidotransferase
MITIVNYGLGNINAFVNVYDRLNIPTKIAKTAEDLIDSKKIILPGVGHFDYAMNRLNSSGMRSQLEFLVKEKKVPVMGICVGMQMLANDSDEGVEKGLGWIDGHVRKFDASLIPYKTRLPHMGWNTMKKVKETPLLKGFEDDSRFYFLHSYYFECKNSDEIISETEYGIKYASVVNKDNIFGIQFHPEKSHSNGINLLKNFALL